MSYTDLLSDITFEESEFEKLLSSLRKGQTLSAVQLLARMDSDSEEVLEDALEQLWALDVTVDLTGLASGASQNEAAVRLREEERIAKSGDLLRDLQESDPLRMYLEELAAIPACGDTVLLSQQLAEHNPNAQDQLMNLSLHRVVQIACEYTGYGVLLMDLIQEGSMCLWENLNRYSGEDFEQFRDACISRGMIKTILQQAHSAGVGQKLRQAMEDYRDIDRKLLDELGRNPTVEEIAEAMHVSCQDAVVIEKMVENARTIQRVEEARKEPEPEPEDEQAVEDTAYFQSRQRIAELLSGLEPLDAQVLSLRFGLEGGLPLNPEQVGKKLGLTPQEVVAAEAAALAKLRQQN